MALLPAARWTLPPHLDIEGNYPVGLVAFHRNGIQRALFGFNSFSNLIPVTTYSVNPTTTGWEYHLSIPSSLIPSGNYFIASAAEGVDGTIRQLPNLPVNVWQTTATYTTFHVNADTGSNGNDGLTAGTAFLTLRFALESLAGNGNGGRIYLHNATNPYGVNTLTTVPVTTTRYLNIELAPGATKANVVLTSWAQAFAGITKLRFKGITIKCPIIGSSADTVLFDDCHLEGTGPNIAIGASGWTPGWAARYFTDGEVSACLNGLFAFDLVRGATVTNVGGAAFESCACVIDSTATTVGAGITLINAASQDNLVYFDVACHDCTVGVELHPSAAQTLTNCAMVNVVADASLSSTIRDYALDHFIAQNWTFPGHTFTLSTDSIAFSVFRQLCFKTFATSAGDILGPPPLSLLNPIFSDCHVITPGAITPGAGTTTGSAAFTNEGANDFTPAAGSDLFDQHTAAKLAPCDAEKVSRELVTTVGALKGADEGAGGGTGPPTDLDYNPGVDGILKVVGQTGTAIPTITPTWGGTITKFEVLPSIYHAYQAPPEIPCTPDMAHYEVRAWAPGDPTDSDIPGPGHKGWIIEDLRNGKKYLRNPKVSGASTHSALAVACNLAAPHASNAGTYEHSLSGGPFAIADGPTERPVIRYRGQLLGGSSENAGSVFFAPNFLYAFDTGGTGLTAPPVGWAQSGHGGFYPLTTGPVGFGVPLKLSIVGATGGKADHIGHIGMGPGFKKPDGTNDVTSVAADILIKDITTRLLTSTLGTGLGHIGSDLGKRTGRLRLYDCTFSAQNFPGLFGGIGFGSVIKCGAGQHFDFRRNIFPIAQEHGCYFQAVNAGIYRDATLASGETADSWFIDNVWPQGTGRTAFQFVDRPIEQQIGGAGSPFSGGWGPTTLCMPCGRGVVLFERNRVYKGTIVPGEDATWFGPVAGADMTYVFRDNEIHQEEGLAATWTDMFGASKPIQGLKRGIICFGWATNGASSAHSIRINENGYAIKRVVVISHKDFTNGPEQKRMSFRGVEEVHIYGFEHITTTGANKEDIGLDEADSSPFDAWYNQWAPWQVNLDGQLVYASGAQPGGNPPSFGTPLSNGGSLLPHNDNTRVFFYMGYPALPRNWHGWASGAGNGRVLEAVYPLFGTIPVLSQGAMNDLIDSHGGVPIDDGAGGLTHIGLTLNQTTGVISGTPSAGIGKGLLNEVLGTEIDSPLTYTASTPAYANIPIKGSNASDDDAWDADGIQLLVFPIGDGDIFPVSPTAVVTSHFPVPGDVLVSQDESFISPTAEVRSDAGGFGLLVDDAGGPDLVTAPTAEVRAWLDGAFVSATNLITPPTAEVRAFFDAVFVGQVIADADGQVLTGGCQDGQVV